MSTSEDVPTAPEDARTTPLRAVPGAASEPGSAGRWSAKSIAVVSAVVVLAMAAAGGGVYWWQHSKLDDAAPALAAAQQGRDQALAEVSALQTQVDALTGQVDDLTAQVGRLQTRVDGYRTQVSDLQDQLDGVAGAAACAGSVMLPAVQRSLGSEFGSVDIQECMHGYARVWANVADPQPGMEAAEQVFLKDVDGSWQYLTSGTGIDCSPPYLPAELETACQALGLA